MTNTKFFSIVTPNSLSFFCNVAISTFLMLSTGINMLPAILMNMIYACNQDTPLATLVENSTSQIFSPRPWRPFSAAFYRSTFVSLMALACTATTQVAARFLGMLMSVSRTRTVEQNATAIAAQWNATPFLFLSNTVAEKISAFLIFFMTVYVCYLGVQFLVSEIHVYNVQRAMQRLQKNFERHRARNPRPPTVPLHFARAPMQVHSSPTVRPVNPREREQQEIFGQICALRELRAALQNANTQPNIDTLRQSAAKFTQTQPAEQRNAETIAAQLRRLAEINAALQQETTIADIDVLFQLVSDLENQEEKNPPAAAAAAETVNTDKPRTEPVEESVATQLPNGFMATEPAECNFATVEDDNGDDNGNDEMMDVEEKKNV